jgi:hypothetical protein
MIMMAQAKRASYDSVACYPGFRHAKSLGMAPFLR